MALDDVAFEGSESGVHVRNDGSGEEIREPREDKLAWPADQGCMGIRGSGSHHHVIDADFIDQALHILDLMLPVSVKKHDYVTPRFDNPFGGWLRTPCSIRDG